MERALRRSTRRHRSVHRLEAYPDDTLRCFKLNHGYASRSSEPCTCDTGVFISVVTKPDRNSPIEPLSRSKLCDKTLTCAAHKVRWIVGVTAARLYPKHEIQQERLRSGGMKCGERAVVLHFFATNLTSDKLAKRRTPSLYILGFI